MTTTTAWPLDADMRSCFDAGVLATVLAGTWAALVDPRADLVPVPPMASRLALVAEVVVTGPTPVMISLGIDHEGARSVARAMQGRGGVPAGGDGDSDAGVAMGRLVTMLGHSLTDLLPQRATLGVADVITRTIGSAGTSADLAVRLAWGVHLVTLVAEDLAGRGHPVSFGGAAA